MSENNVIIWSKDYFLVWSDFKAESNSAAFEDSHSVIKYQFTWTVNSEKITDQILFFVENIQISAAFHSPLSWVRDSQTSIDLLKHEQGHFDLGELVKRGNLEKLQNNLYGKRFPTRGKNEEQRKQFAKEDSGRIIVSEIKKLEQLLFQKCKEYDDQTDFGQNLVKQSEYNLLFDKLRL